MRPLLLLLLLCGAITPFAQKSPNFPEIKYGRIDPADLERKVYAIDSSASAVVISDIGICNIEGNNRGSFSVVFKHHKRVHILNKNGYHHGDITIPVYSSGDAEVELENLKAVTYNLENGKIVESKLEKSNVFKEKIDRNYSLKKFTLPNIKEGSIIEYEYRIVSDYISRLRPWAFQDDAPNLWSEFRVTIPQFFRYTFLSQGYQPFFINEQKSGTTTYMVMDATTTGATDRTSVSAGYTEYRWAMKDVPALKKESFTSDIGNHVSKIEFQLSATLEPLVPRNIMGTWTGLTNDLLKNEYFGAHLSTSNSWLADVVKPMIAEPVSELARAKKIFEYVRNNITCTDHSSVYMDQSLKNVLKTRNGNVAEINLLLTAMMRYAGIQADPVILSTTDNGYTFHLYPLLSRFNYVVSRVLVDGKEYMLDASRARLGFGRLAADCYNGHARIVDERATAIFLSADSLKERKVTSMFIRNNDKGEWIGALQQASGYNESFSIRDKIKEKGKDAFFAEVKKAYPVEVEITQPVIDSLDQYEHPVGMRYNVAMRKDDEDILYVNPMFGEGYKENPFKSAVRVYPVEMPYTMDETYVLSMEVPAGYEVDELPKQVAVKLNEQGDGYFEYLVTHSGNVISLRSRIKLLRAYFTPEEYDYMREFFMMVVNKHSEQIVFKKKK